MSQTKPIQLTAEGKRKLEEELHTLLTDRRQEVVDRIMQAKDFGDISESGEYEDAKNDQNMVERRIRELESWLNQAEVIDEKANSDRSTVKIGTTITIVDDKGNEEVYHLVSIPEARSSENKISDESPFGSAMLGKKKGEKFSVKAPVGQLNFTIRSIE